MDKIFGLLVVKEAQGSPVLQKKTNNKSITQSNQKNEVRASVGEKEKIQSFWSTQYKWISLKTRTVYDYIVSTVFLKPGDKLKNIPQVAKTPQKTQVLRSKDLVEQNESIWAPCKGTIIAGEEVRSQTENCLQKFLEEDVYNTKKIAISPKVHHLMKSDCTRMEIILPSGKKAVPATPESEAPPKPEEVKEKMIEEITESFKIKEDNPWCLNAVLGFANQRIGREANTCLNAAPAGAFWFSGENNPVLKIEKVKNDENAVRFIFSNNYHGVKNNIGMCAIVELEEEENSQSKSSAMVVPMEKKCHVSSETETSVLLKFEEGKNPSLKVEYIITSYTLKEETN